MAAMQGSGIGSLLTSPPPHIVRSAMDIDTTGWNPYKNLSYGFEMKLPPGYDIQEEKESLTVAPSAPAGPAERIIIEKVRGNLQSEIVESMEQGGWKVLDRQLYVLIAPYFSDSADTMQGTYLFVRDFTARPFDGYYTILRATIHTTRDAVRTAVGTPGKETLLLPEQILATVRFLSYGEIETERKNVGR